MRWSQWYIPTLKEAPGDAEVISHKLLIRAGMIRKLTSGIYTWLPLGLRTLNKAANIVREEMDRAGVHLYDAEQAAAEPGRTPAVPVMRGKCGFFGAAAAVFPSFVLSAGKA